MVSSVCVRKNQESRASSERLSINCVTTTIKEKRQNDARLCPMSTSMPCRLFLLNPTFSTGHATPQRPWARVVAAVSLLEKPVGDRPHTRHVEQQSVPRFVVGFVAGARCARRDGHATILRGGGGGGFMSGRYCRGPHSRCGGARRGWFLSKE